MPPRSLGITAPGQLGVCSTPWLVGVEDEPLVAGLRADGVAAAAVPLWMRDLDTSATLAAAALAAQVRSRPPHR